MNDVAELKQEELSQAERAALEGIVWRKLDRWILPLCTSFFFLSFLVCLQTRSHDMLKYKQCVGQDQHWECACGWLADIAGPVELSGASSALFESLPRVSLLGLLIP